MKSLFYLTIIQLLFLFAKLQSVASHGVHERGNNDEDINPSSLLSPYHYSTTSSMNDLNLGIYRSHERSLYPFLSQDSFYRQYEFKNHVHRILSEDDNNHRLLNIVGNRLGPSAIDKFNSIINPFQSIMDISYSSLPSDSTTSENIQNILSSLSSTGTSVPQGFLLRENVGSESPTLVSVSEGISENKNSLRHHQYNNLTHQEALYSRQVTEYFMRVFNQEPAIDGDCDTCLAHYRAIYDEFMETAEAGLVDMILPLCDKLWPALLTLSSTQFCDPNISTECRDLCVGMVHSWSGVVAELLGSLLHDPDTNCQRTQACPTPDWDTIKPAYPTTVVKSAGKITNYQPFSLVHLTDVHIDRNYEKGAIVDCKMPVCCHSLYGFPGDEGGASSFGEYECDSPDELVHSVLHDIVTEYPYKKPKHLIFTGDAPAHDLWLQTKSLNVGTMLNLTSWSLTSCGYDKNTVQIIDDMIDDLSNVEATIAESSYGGAVIDTVQTENIDYTYLRNLKKQRYEAEQERTNHVGHIHDNTTQNNIKTTMNEPSIKYWPVIGNHAGAPVDQFGGPVKDAWLYGPIANAWGSFIPNDSGAKTTLAWGGYYTAPMQPGLHVIGLQTNFYDPINLYLKMGSHHWDMAGQLAWFEDVLQQIKNLGERTIVMAHEKPRSFMEGVWGPKFIEVLGKYQTTIVGLYFGHNHNDMFHLIRPRTATTSPIGISVETEVQLYDQEFWAHKKINSSKIQLPHLKTTLNELQKLLRQYSLNIDMNSSIIADLKSKIQKNIEQQAYLDNIIKVSTATLESISSQRLQGLELVKKRKFQQMIELQTQDQNTAVKSALSSLGTPTNVIYIPSSLSPVDYETNPSYRTMLIDGITFSTLDYVQHRFNLSLGKEVGGITWEKVYTAKSTFNLKKLNPAGWEEFVAILSQNNAAWMYYLSIYHGGLDDQIKKHDHVIVDKSKIDAACYVGTSLSDEYTYCVELLTAIMK